MFSIGACSLGEGAPVPTRDVFSEDELAQLRGFPESARAGLIRYFTGAPADEAFARKFRGRGNVHLAVGYLPHIAEPVTVLGDTLSGRRGHLTAV